jgi:hypothetical protein
MSDRLHHDLVVGVTDHLRVRPRLGALSIAERFARLQRVRPIRRPSPPLDPARHDNERPPVRRDLEPFFATSSGGYRGCFDDAGHLLAGDLPGWLR